MLAAAARWVGIAGVVALLAGTSSAIFLLALEGVGVWREAHRWVIWLLPVAGFVSGCLYLRFGRSLESGNNLLIDEIHDGRAVLPWRLAPMIAASTLLAHAFGASVGREGTAVQMGGALADRLSTPLRLSTAERQQVLMMGMAGGFAAVFGTPWAAALFAIEVLIIGRLRWRAFAACAATAWLADAVCRLWGAHHTLYAVPALAAPGARSLLAMLLVGGLCGLLARVFVSSTSMVARQAQRWIAYPPLRPAAGGAMVALLVWLLDAYDYVGLGLPTIARAFAEPLVPWAFAEKLGFTVLSLGAGFKGGEVTPLFFLGATLGNALAPLLQLPLGMLAGAGMVAVFAGATNTPLASTVMAIELFGPAMAPFAALACFAASLLSGYSSIYDAQRTGRGKLGGARPGIRLADLTGRRRGERER